MIHIQLLDTFLVSTMSDFKLLLKFSNSTAAIDVIPTRLCKFILTNSPDYFIALINSPDRVIFKPIQTRCREAAHEEVEP